MVSLVPNEEGERGSSAPAVRAVIGKSDQDRLLGQWNDTHRPFPAVCVHQLFEEQVRRTPDAIALVCGDDRLTYQELNERANQVAHFLMKNKVGPETLVGVCLERSFELVIALLGVWKAGAAYIPLDPIYPAERLAFMVEDGGIRILLTERKCRGLFSAPHVRVICLDQDWLRMGQEDTENPVVEVAPSNLAYVMYTSGSTGQPKGAMILHSGLANYLTWAIEAYGVVPGGSVPVHSSIAFDLTVTSLYPALLAGAQVDLLADDVGAQHLLSALRDRHDRCLVKITPAHLDVLTHLLRPEELMGLTRVFVIGGENLPAESLAGWRERAPGTRLINEYGPTETVVGCCVHEVQPSDPQNGPVPIGRPIANTELYVLDENRALVPIGTLGELYIGGAGVARGYLNRPELTAERFVTDPFSGRPGARLYKTGDLARYRPDGVLEFMGRVDNQVKVRGYRIELGEIEAALASHPDVQACVVLAREDSIGAKQLVAYIVARPGVQVTGEDLASFLKRGLPEYMVPAHTVFLDALPLTVNGKVDRKALPAPTAPVADPTRVFTAPRNDVERAIASLWSQLLEVERIGVDDDFFELGGHSLLAIRLLARIRDDLGVDLPSQILFERSSLADLAALVARSQGDIERPQVKALPLRGSGSPGFASFAQHPMWLVDQMVPGSPAYNIVDVVVLRGAYHAKALEDAFGILMHRHETLRTSFAHEDGQLIQQIAPSVELPLLEVDLSALSEEERQRQWCRLASEIGRTPLDLSRAPLLRVRVVHASPAEHRVLLTIHHIIADEWSMDLIHSELTALYHAFVEGQPSPLTPLRAQYADYADWQRDSLQGTALDHLRYWKAELAGAQTVLALPTDKPRPPVMTLRGATEAIALPRDLLGKLQALGRQEQATLFMTLEAAFATLLYRYTGQDDILVGTPMSGRHHSETQQMLGCFLNTVVLRSEFKSEESFLDLLRQTRKHTLGAVAHAEFPFALVVSELAPERDASRTPLFQVMFILHSRGGSSRVAKLSTYGELETGTSKTDLTLFISETNDGLEGLIEYSTDLFDAETIRRLARSYGQILQSVAVSPEQKLASLPILTDLDRQQLLVEWNRTETRFGEGELLLHQLFARQAAATPDRTALVFGPLSMTYSELDRRSTALAQRLVSLGVGPDVLVGLLVERSLDMVVGLLGILKAGGAYVPLDPSFPPERLGYVVEDARMPVLVTHRELATMLNPRPSAVVQLDLELPEDLACSAEEAAKSASSSARALAYVLYTSGSTGKPKGVGISHAAIVNFILSMQVEPGIKDSDVLLAVTTLSFDIAGLELFLPLVAGAKVVIASRQDVLDPLRLMGLLRDQACSILQATPATWRALIEAGWKGSPGLKALCGGEAMPPDLAGALLGRCGQLWNMYGPTETTVWSTVHQVRNADTQPPIGKPIANTTVYILDANLAPIPPGAVGELYIGGRGLARGYLNREELTRERFVPDPFKRGERMYRTGDLARWRVDAVLECLGRTDHQVKLRGYRIELGEIEACIARHPGVRQNVVVAREDVPGDKRLVAYYVPSDGASDLAEPLRVVLRAAVPEYMVPAHFVSLSSLPLTPNGKVDRKALPVPSAGEGGSGDGRYEAPRSELEIGIAKAWQRVLKVERVGIHDSFFELGGNSLAVVKLMVEIEKLTGIEINLGSFFRFPTIAGLVQKIGENPEQDASLIIPLQPDGDGPPIFCLSGILLYQELATALGKDQPVYGVYVAEEHALTRQALKVEKLTISSVRLAQAYYDAIIKIAPHGPYRLTGVSFGGLVALDVASMMRRNGASVEFVALLDSLSPQAFRRDWVSRARYRAQQLTDGQGLKRVMHKLSEIRVRLAARIAPPSPGNDREFTPEEAHARKQDAFYEAVGSWNADRLRTDYKIILFRAADQYADRPDVEPDYGWYHYLGAPPKVVDIPGDHLGILRAPNVTELARKIRLQMETTAPPSPSPPSTAKPHALPPSGFGSVS